ncbi:hypothetical protein W97_04423 [Coniosporium apollinis CBS 100218]|uniref:RING-type E3 ubiquitin transferase n=1 Tax=Coniosporium apollinis (strain CBS 100218) TaxID=1168221 RepID=R7YU51_CONA1|nr:uncharacterized protein W97_04423 [Coniosporium apollinis CBS 100218]EON65186.1 hypothetical protein W97_04423 [Coniosporium apollinis CBS 100218]
MRFAAYVGVRKHVNCTVFSNTDRSFFLKFTATLAVAAISRAYIERPNWYSRMVYVGQSDASIMIMANLALLIFGSLFYGLQRLVFGALRPIEREQLYENCWYQVTETLLALTMFRESIGLGPMSMFVILTAAKIWQWLVEARVEFVEQQPPASPTWFYKRLTSAITFGCLADWALLHYSLRTFVEEARPGIMVLFSFEFALVLIAAMSNAARYLFILRDMFISERQVQARVAVAKAQIRAHRAEIQRQIDAGSVPPRAMEDAEREDSVDPSSFDVPGWEEKGRYIFLLDLLTDLVKLLVYIAFFSMLLAFHGLPIHILRDVYMTVKSFVKRINDFVKYRRATRNMNSRYPDATAEDLSGDDNTCIICREEMQPWNPNGASVDGVEQEERHRPKKLPCGHILHMSCLRGWLERQQVCPTCRRPVLTENPRGTGHPLANLEALQAEAFPRNGNNNNPARGQQPRGRFPALDRFRIFNLGPFRFAIGGIPERELRQMNQILNQQDQQPQPTAAPLRNTQRSPAVPTDPATRLAQIEAMFFHARGQIDQLNADRQQLSLIYGMELEFERIRRQRNSAILRNRTSERLAERRRAEPAARTGSIYDDEFRQRAFEPHEYDTAESAAQLLRRRLMAIREQAAQRTPSGIQRAEREQARENFRQHLGQPSPSELDRLRRQRERVARQPLATPLQGRPSPARTLIPNPHEPALNANSRELPLGMTLPPGWLLVPFQENRPGENTRQVAYADMASALRGMHQPVQASSDLQMPPYFVDQGPPHPADQPAEASSASDSAEKPHAATVEDTEEE